MARGWALAATEDASRFNATGLAAYNVVVFLSTTGEVLDDTQSKGISRARNKKPSSDAADTLMRAAGCDATKLPAHLEPRTSSRRVLR